MSNIFDYDPNLFTAYRAIEENNDHGSRLAEVIEDNRHERDKTLSQISANDDLMRAPIEL